MLSAIALLAAVSTSPATPAPEDTQNIALSTAILQRIGDRLWPHWTQTPFAIDLITANGPAEINFDKPLPAPSFPPQFEATFPWPNGIPTIVIGEPQFTQANRPIRWSVTLLHEHFHQWQYSWPGYQSATKALGLAPPGDTDAMWMLNYPFPYNDARTNSAYVAAAHRLATAVENIRKPGFTRDVALFLRARGQFRATLKPPDYKYFAFQCWQEGTARYTEIMVARLAAAEHARDRSFLSDPQAAALAQDSAATFDRSVKRLKTMSLANDDRLNFYAFGAGEALVLDALHPQWRTRYLDPHLDLGVFL